MKKGDWRGDDGAASKIMRADVSWIESSKFQLIAIWSRSAPDLTTTTQLSTANFASKTANRDLYDVRGGTDAL